MKHIQKSISILLVIIFFISGCMRPKQTPGSVSGVITNFLGDQVAGVTVVAENQSQVATSNASGIWHIDQIKGRTRIVPSRVGNEFVPPSRTVSGSTRNVSFHIVTPIMGEPVATREEARQWLQTNLLARTVDLKYLDLVDHYYDIAPIYGIRADVALAQAVHETGFFKYGGIVEDWQNNFAGIGATGTASDGKTKLNGADPDLVRFQAGIHGAIFATPEAGVEAQIQHLYAYATTAPRPPGRPLISPRFTLVRRGAAPIVEYLGAGQNPEQVGWAPSREYGFKVVHHLEGMLATAAARK